MAISIVGGTAVGASSSVIVSKPTGVQSGDLILILIESSGPSGLGLPTAPTGFTTLDSRTDTPAGQSAVVVAYKVAGGSEPTSYTWTQGANSTFNVWSCIALRGQDGTTPIDAHGSAFSTTTSITVAALTATLAGDALILMLTDINDVDVSTWPSGVSENASASNPAGNGVVTGTKLSLASGSTGSLAMTMAAAPGGVQAFGILVKAPSAGTAWNQAVSDSHSGLDILAKSPTKRLSEAQSALDALLKGVNHPLSDTTSGLDVLAKQVQKAAIKEATSATDAWQVMRGALLTLLDAFSEKDTLTRAPSKGLTDSTSGQESIQKAVTHTLQDAISQLDTLAKMPVKTFVDLFSEFDSATATRQAGGVAWTRNISDAHSALDLVARNATKLSADQWSSVDAVTHVWAAHLLITEAFSEQDTTLKLVRHVAADTLSLTDRVTAGRALLLTILDAISQRDGVTPSLLTSSGRKTLAMVTSLVASRFGISITLLSPVLGAQLSATSTLGGTSALLTPTLAASSSTTNKLSATASLL